MRRREISIDHIPPFLFEVHEADDQYVSPGIMQEGTWEPFETEVIRRCLDKDTDFYDVGANIGWYSVVGGLCLNGGCGSVHAFEPVLENAALVLRNVVANGLSNVRINPCALGDQTQAIDLHLSSTNKGDHQAHKGEPEREIQPGSMTRFDRYYTPSPRKTFIKMDTQGSELAIIEGMGEYLHSIDDLTMLIEFWPKGLEHRLGNVERLIELLSRAGFHALTVVEDDNHVRPADWPLLARAAESTLAPDTGRFVNLLLYRSGSIIPEKLLDLYDAAPSHHLPAINNQTTKRTAPVVSPISNEGVDMSVELQNEIEGLKREISTLKNTIQGIEQICRETRGLVGPFGVPMPDNKMLVQTIHGTKYVIDPHDNVMAPQLIVYRQWEPDLSSLIKSLCKPDTIFVDVGANFGYFSCLAGAKIGTGGKGQVFSIEPNPKLVGLLNTNVQINWSMAPVHVHAVAASDQSGEATLFIPTTGAANASLSYGSENSERVTVTTQRLDDIINPELVIDVMKIDVEGHEVSALKGALQIIKNSPNIVIIMEWSIGQMTNAGHKIDDIITLLNDLNLKAYDIPWSGDMSVSKEIKYDDLRKILYSNIILRRDFT